MTANHATDVNFQTDVPPFGAELHMDERQQATENTSVVAEMSDSTRDRWLSALLQSAPTLPKPIAEAVVDGVARGPLGESLKAIDQGLIEILQLSLESLTGSEVRVLGAILEEIKRTVAHVEDEIERLYAAKDN